MTDTARWYLTSGGYYPFDAPTEWWDQTTINNSLENPAPEPVDWAHSAARGVIDYVRSCRSIEHQDDQTRILIAADLADIIRLAAADGHREASVGKGEAS